jgi:hypothetical protein
MLPRVALVRTHVSEERSASFIRVTRIVELGTTLVVTSNRRTLRRNIKFLQEPHGVTSQKTPFFIVTAVKISNLTKGDKLNNARREGSSYFRKKNYLKYKISEFPTKSKAMSNRELYSGIMNLKGTANV